MALFLGAIAVFGPSIFSACKTKNDSYNLGKRLRKRLLTRIREVTDRVLSFKKRAVSVSLNKESYP
jgi:hypothetical protein